MNVLITGASGFLGSHIAELLTHKNFSVRCLVRPSSELQFLKTLLCIEFVNGALDDPASLRQAVDGIDAIIHCAGITQAVNPKDFYHVNVDGTAALLTAAERYAPSLKRFILISSISAVGPSANKQPISDFTTPSPVSHYGRSKLSAENKAREFLDRIPITILRSPVIYGPRDKQALHLFKCIQQNLLVLPLGHHPWISIIYAADAAKAVLSAMSSNAPSGSTYYIDDGKTHQLSDLLLQLATALGTNIKVKIPVPLFFIKLLSILGEHYSYFTQQPVILSKDKFSDLKQLYWLCDSSKIRSELNWTHDIDWLTGAQQTYAWYKKEGWL